MKILEDLSVQWLALIEWSGLSDRMIFILGNSLIVFVFFWPLNFLLYLSYKFKLFQHFLIQPGVAPSEELVYKNMRENIISHITAIPLLSYLLYDIFDFFNIQIRAPLPSCKIIIRDLCVAIFFTDMFGYWTHRMMHHRSVYKYVHKKHHEYKVNVGTASIYAHPLEDLVTNINAVFGNMIMGSHVLVLWLWLSIRLVEAVLAHSGYHFLPYSLSFPFTGGDYHEFHHSHNIGNYGQFFTFWDWIMGTDVAYYKWQRQQKQKLQ